MQIAACAAKYIVNTAGRINLTRMKRAAQALVSYSSSDAESSPPPAKKK